MTPRNSALTLSLPAAIALLAAAIAHREPAPVQAAQAKIGVVDLERLIQAYPGMEAREAEFGELNGQFEAHMAGLRKELDELKIQRDGNDPDTAEFMEADLQVQLKALEAERTVEMFKLRQRRKNVDIQLEIYDDLLANVEEFAKARGLDLVLRKHAMDPATPRSVRLETAQANGLLFHTATLDITEDVIQFLKSVK